MTSAAMARAVLFYAVLSMAGSVMTDDARSEGISVGGIALDAAYAGFSYGNIIDNEKAHPGYGYTVAYHGGDRGDATIYVYSKNQPDIPDGPISETVMVEFN